MHTPTTVEHCTKHIHNPLQYIHPLHNAAEWVNGVCVYVHTVHTLTYVNSLLFQIIHWKVLQQTLIYSLFFPIRLSSHKQLI